MRVLWFLNSPALGKKVLQPNIRLKGTGGWLDSLNELMDDKINLHIAFHFPYKHPSFKFKNSTYYPIFTENIFLNFIKTNYLLRTTDDDYIKSYLKIIDLVKPDIIHIHGTENSFLCLIEKVSTPVLVSIQGNITVYNHKYFSGFHGKYLFYRRINNFFDLLFGYRFFGLDKLRFSNMSIVEQRRMKDIKFIMGRTSWDYRITRILSPKSKYFSGEEALRETFYRFQWNNVYNGNGKIIIFTISSDHYYKGAETLFHSLRLLLNLNFDVEWRIAGIDYRNLVVAISKRYLRKNFPTKGYTLLGPLDEEQLVQELLNAHLYVMPSHIENSPNNLCEAMILGLPCISTFAGGTGSLLKDGEDGILIQNGDPWAMAGAILELVNDPEKASRMGKNARKRALERHDREKIAKSLIDTYKAIIDGK